MPAWDKLQPDVDFASMFLDQEGEDEDATSLGEALAALDDFTALRGAKDFKSGDVAELLNKEGGTNNAIIPRSHLFPREPADAPVSAKSVGKRLKAHVGEAVTGGGAQCSSPRRCIPGDTTRRYVRFSTPPLVAGAREAASTEFPLGKC